MTGWQAAPHRQAQRSSQRTPKAPSGQAVGRGAGGLSLSRGDSLDRGSRPGELIPQPCPLLPTAHPAKAPHSGVTEAICRGPRGLLASPMGPRAAHSRLWHLSPVQPAGQRQWPVCGSQRPPLRHPQLCGQPASKTPGRHSAETGQVMPKGPGHLPCPCFLHPELQIPVLGKDRRPEVVTPQATSRALPLNTRQPSWTTEDRD